MTEKTITVYVEWALQGKTLGRAGARVLACSNGDLNKDNFAELIGRFSIGTPDALPQVSVSYLTSGAPGSRAYYLGMAIHRWAADVRTDGGELLERDDDNRPVATTTYFCVPYQLLADAAITYRAMYREFSKIRLSNTNGLPLEVKLPIHTGPPEVNALTMQSASRLLTSRSVCVLGADLATVAERLDFIDATAALLPYGFRTRLAAATWARPTHRDHRFRLFFSAAKRDASPPDDVIYWGIPERTRLTPREDYAYAYDRWLADTVGQLQTLGELTTPRSFNREEIFESFDEIGLLRPSPDEAAPDLPAQRSPAPMPAMLDGERLLRDCASCMQASDVPGLHTAIRRLRAWAKSTPSFEEQDRYRRLIREQRLFRHDETLGNIEARLREALLEVAFCLPLNYRDYCVIEESTSADSSDEALLRMIADAGMADMRISAVVYAQLPQKDMRKKREKWFASHQVNAVQLINTLAGDWQRTRHALHASLLTAEYVIRMPGDPDLIRRVLMRHGYLVRLLQVASGGDDEKQVSVLAAFLGAAYPNGIGPQEISHILIENAETPSPAVLAAVLTQLAHPNDALMAREAFVSRAMLALNVASERHKLLESRVVYAYDRPGDPDATGLSYPPTDRR